MIVWRRLRAWLADHVDGLGLYWHEEHPPAHHGEGRRCGYLTGCGFWRERWWAPSRLWRQKTCYLGLHRWCFVGDNPSHWSRDYWFVGYWWRAWQQGYDSAWRRFCADCATHRGVVKRRRPASVMLACCPGCGIADAFLSTHGHDAWCGGDDRQPRPA